MAEEIEEESRYYVLDSRARTAETTVDGQLCDIGKYVVVAGSFDECRADCNNNEYGEDCVIADSATGKILWNLLNKKGKWKGSQFPQTES